MSRDSYIEGAFKFVKKKGWKPYAAFYLITERFPTGLDQEDFVDMGERFDYDEYWAIKKYEEYSGKRSPLKKEYEDRMLDKEILEDTDFTGDWFSWENRKKKGDDPPAGSTEVGDLPF